MNEEEFVVRIAVRVWAIENDLGHRDGWHNFEEIDVAWANSTELFINSMPIKSSIKAMFSTHEGTKINTHDGTLSNYPHYPNSAWLSPLSSIRPKKGGIHVGLECGQWAQSSWVGLVRIVGWSWGVTRWRGWNNNLYNTNKPLCQLCWEIWTSYSHVGIALINPSLG